jgi:hypothetical protein
MARLSFGPLIKSRNIDYDLAVGSEFDMRPVHRSRAGPSKLTPSLSYPLPWHGHLNLFSLAFQSGVHPRCVQRA